MPPDKGYKMCTTKNFLYCSVTNPIDVMKVRLQLDNELVTAKYGYNGPSRYYNGFLQGGLRIYKEEGIRGLYKG